MSYKNRAYSNKTRSGSRSDAAGHLYHTQQQKQQDHLIKKWLQENNIPASQLRSQ